MSRVGLLRRGRAWRRPAIHGECRRHDGRRRACADLAGRLDSKPAQHVVGAVLGERLERRQRGAVADLAEREDRVPAHGGVDVAREDVEDRARRARIPDLAERGEDALLRRQVRGAQEQLLDEQPAGVFGVRVAERVDRLDADAHVGIVRRLEEIFDRLRLVDLAERPDGFEAGFGVVAVQLADVVVELLIRLRTIVSVPETVAALRVERDLRNTDRREGEHREREQCRRPSAHHRRGSLAQGSRECNRRRPPKEFSSGGDVIRQRWLEVARATHPDVGGDGVRFRQVKQAYEILRDPARRAEYERFWVRALGPFERVAPAEPPPEVRVMPSRVPAPAPESPPAAPAPPQSETAATLSWNAARLLQSREALDRRFADTGGIGTILSRLEAALAPVERAELDALRAAVDRTIVTLDVWRNQLASVAALKRRLAV